LEALEFWWHEIKIRAISLGEHFVIDTADRRA